MFRVQQNIRHFPHRGFLAETNRARGDQRRNRGLHAKILTRRHSRAVAGVKSSGSVLRRVRVPRSQKRNPLGSELGFVKRLAVHAWAHQVGHGDPEKQRHQRSNSAGTFHHNNHQRNRAAEHPSQRARGAHDGVRTGRHPVRDVGARQALDDKTHKRAPQRPQHRAPRDRGHEQTAGEGHVAREGNRGE